ncbi:MAG: enoyl-CoA hydratase/isomerase family protein [Chloroflexi bacterium]|nr:enoyl-CoA hydratase/isomerase family protein [Chloroflexota bacterium]
MNYKTINFNRVPPKGTITLSRPQVLNAINKAMLLEIQEVVKKVTSDKEVRVLVIDSACDRAFSAGIDVAYVKDISVWGGREIGKELHQTFGALRFLEKPIIAAIDGLCLGAGLELAVSCDILIATKRSRFGLPNINVGIPAIVEAAILPHALSILDVKELCFTGEFWDAARAERRGLLTRLVPNNGLAAEVDSWVAKLSQKSPLALATQKDIINKWMTTDLETAIDFSINTVSLHWSTKDQREGMSAFLEKRKPEFKGK